MFVSVVPGRTTSVDNGAREREDAAQDLREHIVRKKKDWLELVAGPDRADISVVIVGRSRATTDQPESLHPSSARSGGNGDRAPLPAISGSRESMAYSVKAVLTAGDHREELTAAVSDTYMLGGPWRAAAAQLASAIEQFARNQSRDAHRESRQDLSACLDTYLDGDRPRLYFPLP